MKNTAGVRQKCQDGIFGNRAIARECDAPEGTEPEVNLVGRTIFLMLPLITLKKINHSSEALVQTLLDAIPTYYLLIDGVPNAGSAKAVFEELPPGRTYEDKHVLLIEEDGIPAGVIDLVIGYPQDKVAYIGLLVLDECRQGRGLGKATYQLLENYIRGFEVDSIQLGVNDTNHPGMAFWPKLGFQRNGRSRAHQGKKIISTVIVMEKSIT